MQFTLICRDGDGSLNNRMNARSEHMAGLKLEKASGTIRDGGAILDRDKNMIGSVVLCEFEDRDALNKYLFREIYALSGVWEDIEILEMHFVDWPKLLNLKEET